MEFLKNIFTGLFRIHSSFFTHFFIFSNILNPILKFGGDRFRLISVKFTEFVNLVPDSSSVSASANIFLSSIFTQIMYSNSKLKL
jgi:hypothetical protein